jgi:DNA-binding GntR family transcriptional regulator
LSFNVVVRGAHTDTLHAMVGSGSLIREGVYGRLRADILSCVLQPGAELRETTLAERFGVSTSPVRDALLRLEADGLISVFPRKGYRVTTLSANDITEVFLLRSIIEPAAAREAKRQASDEALSALDRFRVFPGDDIYPDYTSYNHAFHLAILGLSGSQRIAALGGSLVEEFNRALKLTASPPNGWIGKLVAEHTAIIDALQARDGSRAARLLHTHILRAKTRVLRRVGRSGVAAP